MHISAPIGDNFPIRSASNSREIKQRQVSVSLWACKCGVDFIFRHICIVIVLARLKGAYVLSVCSMHANVIFRLSAADNSGNPQHAVEVLLWFQTCHWNGEADYPNSGVDFDLAGFPWKVGLAFVCTTKWKAELEGINQSAVAGGIKPLIPYQYIPTVPSKSQDQHHHLLDFVCTASSILPSYLRLNRVLGCLLTSPFSFPFNP